MSQNELRSILERLQVRKDNIWKLLVDINISDKMAKILAGELSQLETRIFSIRCKLVRA